MREDIELESCDLGNQSVLHAVKVLRKPSAHIDLEVRGEAHYVQFRNICRLVFLRTMTLQKISCLSQTKELPPWLLPL